MTRGPPKAEQPTLQGGRAPARRQPWSVRVGLWGRRNFLEGESLPPLNLQRRAVLSVYAHPPAQAERGLLCGLWDAPPGQSPGTLTSELKQAGGAGSPWGPGGQGQHTASGEKGTVPAPGGSRWPLTGLTDFKSSPPSRVQPEGHLGWGWGLLLLPAYPQRRPVFTVWGCRCWAWGQGSGVPSTHPGRALLSEGDLALEGLPGTG